MQDWQGPESKHLFKCWALSFSLSSSMGRDLRSVAVGEGNRPANFSGQVVSCPQEGGIARERRWLWSGQLNNCVENNLKQLSGKDV